MNSIIRRSSAISIVNCDYDYRLAHYPIFVGGFLDFGCGKIS